MTGIGIVVAGALLLVFFLLVVTIKRLLWVSTPNEALIFSGATRRVGDRTVGFRFVRGGRE